ncbi:MAG TPA: hypothetical protein VJV21_09600 [Pyrinomonadaceae bacterium]|nr:hypothetical protein [Pyrinomonadaceae bacterium]
MAYSPNDEAPAERPLKAYAFDPSQGRNLGNYMTVNVRNEASADPPTVLLPGPIGRYLAVIDYDASNNVYYEPVDLDDPALLLRGGLDPSESDPRFHQQMVYAVASETIRRFELALGRRIRWGFRGGKKNDPFRGKLRIFPHAMQEANAYYDRNLRALVFGYFPASETDPGTNLPGQTVFTCLSHDIIAHETAHALIDGQREFFLEATGPDTPAFHEGFADIIALFQHFSYKEALLEVIQKLGGQIYRSRIGPNVQPEGGRPVIQDELSKSNPLVELAQQFGEALGMRAALRQALGTPPNSNALKNLFESHERGAILVAAVFDAYFTIYMRRTRDLMRIAQSSGSATTPGNLHHDLANRLASEAAKAAQHFANICIRALDYCPPIDISFGDFLRAMITADYDLVPGDRHGYREALIEAFRLRGICPSGVTSYAEESLRWCAPEVLKGITPPLCTGLKFNIPNPTTPQQQRHNAITLSRFGKANAKALGLNPKEPVQAYSFHAIHRVAPDGGLKVEMIAELMQQMDVALDPDDKDSEIFTFRGGTTVILTDKGEVRYAIQKNLGEDNKDNKRLKRQRDYYQNSMASMAMAAYGSEEMQDFLPRRGRKRQMNFSLVHRGY